MKKVEVNRKNVTAFKKDYRALIQKHGLRLRACGCCGGLSLINDDWEYLHDVGGPLDPNKWDDFEKETK